MVRVERTDPRITCTANLQPREWESLLHREPAAKIYHTLAWKATLEDALKHIRGRFLGLRDEGSGELIGALPIYAVRSWLLGNRLVSIPLGTFGDPLLDGVEDVGQLRSALEALCRETRARDVRIRVRGRLPVLEGIGFKPGLRYWHHFLPLGDDPEKLKMRFSRTNVRQWIRRAEKGGLVVERQDSEAAIKDFYPLFVNTRRRLGLPWAPYGFFEALRRHLGPDRVSVFTARRGDNPIAGVMTLCFKDMLTLETLGESAAASKTGATQLVYWAAIQWACSHGCRHVSFGQTEKNNQGLARHKRFWGCAEEDLIDYHLPGKESGSRDGMARGAGKNWLRTLIGKVPASMGTVLSKFIYRHWA